MKGQKHDLRSLLLSDPGHHDSLGLKQFSKQTVRTQLAFHLSFSREGQTRQGSKEVGSRGFSSKSNYGQPGGVLPALALISPTVNHHRLSWLPLGRVAGAAGAVAAAGASAAAKAFAAQGLLLPHQLRCAPVFLFLAPRQLWLGQSLQLTMCHGKSGTSHVGNVKRVATLFTFPTSTGTLYPPPLPAALLQFFPVFKILVVMSTELYRLQSRQQKHLGCIPRHVPYSLGVKLSLLAR